MIKFDIINRWTGVVQFTAEIECAEDASTSRKLGLAIKWGVKAGANLRGANLGGANLRGADLGGANLRGADLTGANLRGAYLTGAYLTGADLTGADLRGADLGGANLTGADLRGADFAGGKIRDLVTLGYPDGWNAWTYVTEEGEQRVQVGCRNKTIAEGRRYWAEKPDRREVMAALDYAEAIARIRRWC